MCLLVVHKLYLQSFIIIIIIIIISVMQLGQSLTRSGLTYPEVSSKVCHESFWQLGNIVTYCIRNSDA